MCECEEGQVGAKRKQVLAKVNLTNFCVTYTQHQGTQQETVPFSFDKKNESSQGGKEKYKSFLIFLLTEGKK